jgi:adenosylmethionine-8-amino-7-oxononanoate aminotransferase
MMKDINGTLYIDAISAGFNNTIGHGRQEMAEVAKKQMEQLDYHIIIPGVSNTSTIDLSEKIVTITKSAFPEFESAFFSSGGSEANEAAYHMALRYFAAQGMQSKRKLISFQNAYHGSTFISCSADPTNTSYGWERLTGKKGDVFPKVPFPNGNYFDNSKIKVGEHLGKAAARIFEETVVKEGPDSIAAFIVEPIQGDGGIVIPHSDYFPLIRDICTKYNILLIADEVMTFGKTGKWFAMEHWGCHPDLITIAKGISSGYLPVAAVLLTNKVRQVVMNADKPWAHDYTYSGHPVCSAVALKNLEIIEREGLIERGAEVGQKLLKALTDNLVYLPIVKEVRGIGLMNAVQLHSAKAKEVVSMLLHEEHIIVHSSKLGDTIQIVPAAIISDDHIEKIVSALKRVLVKIGGDRK